MSTKIQSQAQRRHPHAELMMQYAQDAMETHKPWERWEWLGKFSGRWGPLTNHPGWHSDINYRRKPRTIVINGHEVPEPVRLELSSGAIYWIIDPYHPDLINDFVWDGDEHDLRLLSRGLIHLTQEAAEAHAKALLSFTAKE